MELLKLASHYKESNLLGRYICLKHIEPLLGQLKFKNEVSIIGESVLKKPIYNFNIGTGKIKILMWSQMHGDESTTTKALFDFFNYLKSDEIEAIHFLKSFTFSIIPILNPDGAEAYTRENANTIDLNRDAQNLSQPESVVLRALYDDFKPHYCFNLHDQRSIYGAGNTSNPATVSFLAPAFNSERTINESRGKAIDLISYVFKGLSEIIPNQIGRFNDAFNFDCVGDTFQYFKTPTILFEAGHYQNDYDREKTRAFIFCSYLLAFRYLNENDIVDSKSAIYLKIPQNNVNFYDFICRNVKIVLDGVELITSFAANYREILLQGEIFFELEVLEIGNLKGFTGHFEYDAMEKQYSDEDSKCPIIGKKVNFRLDKTIKFVNGVKIN